MDSKKEGNRGSAATGSKMAAASKKQQSTGDQGQTGQGATGQQGQGQGQGGQQDLVQHAKHATGEIVNQVQQQAGTQIERQKESAVNDLSQVVSAVRRFGESLGQEQGGPIAKYAAEYGDIAAQKLEQFANYIREQDPKRLLADVQNFGRRRPGLMLGGAFLLGLAGARLIKSSMDAGSNISAAPTSPTPGVV